MAAAAAAASAAAVSSIASGVTRVIASSSSASATAQVTAASAAAASASSLATSAGSGLAHTIDMPFEWLGGTVMGGVPADYLKVRAPKSSQIGGGTKEGKERGKKGGAEKKTQDGSLVEGWGENEERTRLPRPTHQVQTSVANMRQATAGREVPFLSLSRLRSIEYRTGCFETSPPKDPTATTARAFRPNDDAES